MAPKEALKKRLFDLDSAEIRVGQEVILTIINEGEFSGKISLINAKRDRLQLENVTFCQTKAKLSGKKFYKQEIKSIEIISQDVEHVHAEETNENKAFEIDNKTKFEICGKEFEKIHRLVTTHYRTINCVGEKFDGALDDILKQDVVGLNAYGIENGTITMIGISTPFRIYIFNIKILGEIDNRLKDIIESDERVKVIHDASFLADNLFHCHGVHLKGIFDTMFAHRSLGYSNKPTTLQQCITEYMILPSEFVEAINGDNEESTAHGIDQAFIKQTAILLKFHDFLTEQLLEDAYRSFNYHLNYCRNKDSSDVQFIYRDANSIVHRMNDIPPFRLNIAVEQRIEENSN